ncbi:hypothetical protein [Candidatus Poriferisodalis sp.]|uniref:hypothetical protein n=1 Tax=Candidatus Poriferisodalis sp. TaxID=3101277 RepID=UPI003AF92595
MPTTSTWVVFKEVEEPPQPAAHASVRFPQTDGDVAGAMYWYQGSSGLPGQPPRPFEHAGVVFDRCRVQDAFLSRHLRYPDTDEELMEYQRDWFLSEGRTDCRGVELAAARPLLGFDEFRYFTYSDDGSPSPYVASSQEALEWYEDRSDGFRAASVNSIPAGMMPAGSFGGFDGSVPRIEYSDTGDPRDEVRVLLETVAVGDDGVLRGLVRNWSRTLWAYGTIVGAGDGEWAWPLSVQPGETAPFEIEDWDGPGDATLIEFSIHAEMSNDADLSRAWWGSWDWQYFDYASDSGESDPEFDRYAFGRLDPISHPRRDAAWAPGLVLDLAVYWAELNSEGAVVDVEEVGFHESGPVRDTPGEVHLDGPPLVRHYYPGTEFWITEVSFLVDYASSPYPRMAWIGMPHISAGR